MSKKEGRILLKEREEDLKRNKKSLGIICTGCICSLSSVWLKVIFFCVRDSM